MSRVVLSAALLLSIASVSRAADGTWIFDGAGTWDPATPGTTLWSGNIVAQGADFTADFSAIDITSNRTVTLGAPVTIGNLKFGDTSGAQTWALTGASTLTLDTTTGPAPTITVNNNTATISVALAGGDGLLKAGAGKLVLSGGHTFTGTIEVSAGTLDLWDTTGAYTNNINLSATGATLDAANTASSVITINGNITGSGKINKTSGSSTLILNGNNDYAGGTTLTAGTLVVGSGTNNGIGTGTLTLGGGAFRSSDNIARTLSNAVSMGSNALTLGAVQGAVTGLGDLNFTSTTSSSIGGSKTWTVNNATTVTFANNWSGNSGWSVTKAGTGTLVFNGNLTSSGVGVVVSAGTLTLNGTANTYTGTSTVNGGTLLINGTKSGAGIVTVNSTGTLGGSGTVAGATTAAAGSFLAPGASSGVAGTLTFSSTLDISGLASGTGGLLFNLGSVAGSDKIALSSGALTIGTGALDWNDFNFTTLSGYGVGTYTLFSTTTSVVGTMGSNLSGTVGGLNGTLSISGNDIVLTVSAIPEPSAAALLGGALSLGLAATLRRKRR